MEGESNPINNRATRTGNSWTAVNPIQPKLLAVNPISASVVVVPIKSKVKKGGSKQSK